MENVDFINIYKKYRTRVVNIAKAMLHDADEAEDVCQDVFETLYNMGDTVDFMDEEETAMTEIISIIVALVLGLFGLNVMKSNKIKNQKKEIKTKDEVITKKKDELKTINEVQNKIKEAESAPKPEEKKMPEAGDVASRIERLNKLHNN